MDEPSNGVLVLLDGSETSEHALEHAIGIALERSLPVTCVAVIPPRLWRARQGQFQISPEKHDESFARELLAAGRGRCEKAGVGVRTIVRSGSPAAVLAEEAATYDVLVVGERRPIEGAPTLASIVSGRVATPIEVVREA
jgi:nucleotide-binding universal stress UspA family protein